MHSSFYESKKDLKRAEEYYSRAILADPEDGKILIQYANVVWETHKDEETSQSYFERAAQAAPADSHVLASYASFQLSPYELFQLHTKKHELELLTRTGHLKHITIHLHQNQRLADESQPSFVKVAGQVADMIQTLKGSSSSVLCNQVMRDAVLANKCCLNSFCDKCIRDNIISKSSCVWGAKDVLAEDLIPKKTLRDIITHISDSSSSSNNSVRSNSDSSSSSSSNDSNNSSSKSDLERKHDRESVSSDHKTRADQAGDPNKKRKLSSGPKPLSHTRTCVPCVPLQVR